MECPVDLQGMWRCRDSPEGAPSAQSWGVIDAKPRNKHLPIRSPGYPDSLCVFESQLMILSVSYNNLVSRQDSVINLHWGAMEAKGHSLGVIQGQGD